MTDTNNLAFERAREAIIRCRDARDESLELEHLQFERFPDEITGLTDLKRLVIQSNHRLSSIEGLGNLPALEELQLYECGNFGDFDVLGGLQRLKNLAITGNRNLKSFSDLKALEGLTGIRVIDLSHNPRLKTLNGLQKLQALEELDVSGCENLSDLSVLEGLTAIRRIGLSRNPHLKTLNVLQKMQALEEIVVWNCENLSGLRALEGLTAIRKINLRHNPRLKTLNGLQKMQNLEELDVTDCKNLSDLSALEDLPTIRKINLSENPHLKTLNVLQKMQALEEIVVWNCENLSGLRTLEGLTAIRKIDLSRNPHLKTLNGLQRLQALEELDVSGCRNLSDLSALEGLTGIRVIDLSHNPRLKTLNGLQKMKELEELNVSFCENLSDLRALEGLTGIRRIGLNYNPHLKTLNVLQKMQALEELYALNCKNLSALSALGGLTGIRKIYLSDNPHLKTLNVLQKLQDLEELDVSSCENLSDLSALEYLTCIRKINLDRNPHLKTLNGLQKMSVLEELDVSKCENLFDLSALEGLSGIRKINLHENHRLENLNGLQKMQALEELDVAGCKNLSDLSALEGLTAIRIINLRVNPRLETLNRLQKMQTLEEIDVTFCENLSDLSALEYLTCIRKINLSGNPHLKTLNVLQRLQTLEELNVAGCENLSDLKALGGMASIRKINLGYNPQLENLNKLPKLQSLEELDVAGCKSLSDLRALEGLDLLVEANFHNCGIQEFPRFLLKLNTLCLQGNPLNDFPLELLGDSFFANCIPAANDYFKELAKGEVQNRIRKWLVLGNGRTGKTTLLKALNGEELREDEESTHGIVIRRINVEGIAIKFWDFGGQDLYLATHHLFMKSVDGILLCYRRDEPEKQADGQGWEWENKSLAYWLGMAKTASPNARILPVEIAPAPSKQPDPWDQAKRMLDKETALDKVTVPNAFNDRTNLKYSTEDILLKLQRASERRKYPLPKAWPEVIERLDERRKNEKLLDRDQFEAEAQCPAPDTLLQYLHGSGELFYQPGLFRGQIILDQQWMLDAVYALFDRKKTWITLIGGNNGRFHAVMAKEVWPHNTEDEHKLFLSMMVSCAAAFEATPWGTPFYEKAYILPELCDARNRQWRNMFDNYDGETSTVQFQCPFLHRGVVNNWLAHVGSAWRDEVFYFRHGVGLMIKGNLIQIDFSLGEGEFGQQGSIEVQIKNQSGMAVQDFLDPVLQSIVETLESAGIKDYTQSGEMTRSTDRQDIPPIPAKGRKKKLFVAYKKEEKKILDIVIQSLDQLQRVPGAVFFEYYGDWRLKIGEEWDPRLEQAIRSADAVLFLVSRLFLGNDYCVKEINVARETREKKEKFGEYYGMHPLVLNECEWKDHFGDLQAGPGKVETPLLDIKKKQRREQILLEYVRSVVEQLEQGVQESPVLS